MSKPKEILEFIHEFSKFGKPVVTAFTCGNCYWFAHILHTRFPDSKIVMLPVEGHFVTKINEKLYDIEGNVTTKYKNSPKDDWEEYKLIEPEHSKQIERDCILKTTI